MTTRQFWLGLSTLALAIQAQAATKSGFSCIDLRKASQRLQVHANNIANANTTRTPQGGPYKAIELRCREMYCESVAHDDFKLVYDPSHPDANKSGYVQYPRVDVASEVAAMNSAATEVKLLAATGVCGASALSTNMSAVVKYDPGTSILSDVMNFSSDGRLISWSRTNRDGKSDHLAFNADGTLAGGATASAAKAAAPAASAFAPTTTVIPPMDGSTTAPAATSTTTK